MTTKSSAALQNIPRRSLLTLPLLAAVPHLKAQTAGSLVPTGLKADGAALNTAAIQAAIDRCGSAGGGQVLLPPGRYLTGTLRLRDRVTLYLEDGAVLLGSPRLDDYVVLHDAIPSYTSTYTDKCLIRADSASDLAIRGAGTIDGNGTAFAGEYKVRPYLMRFISCKGVRVEGITLRESPMWMQHYLDCEDVLIDSVRVRSRRDHVNNDGIDIDSCRRVRIANCDIDCGDDAIVLKATAATPCRDVVVTNCILSTLCNAFKLGTESNGGFDNIVFSNSTIYNTRLAGIALEMVDGGALRRVSISNIVMRDTVCPIFVRLGNRARPIAEHDPRPGMGSLSGVMIRGVIAEGASAVSSITGLPESPVENLLLEDIQLSQVGGGTELPPNQQVPEVPEKYPEFQMFGTLPASGLYCRHVRGLELTHVAIRTLAPDARPTLVADDVDGLSVSGLSGSSAASDAPLMDFRNTRRARIRESRPAGDRQPLLRLSGAGTKDVAIHPDEEREGLVEAGPDVTRLAWRLMK